MRRTNIVNTYVMSLYEQKSVGKGVIHECDSMYEIYTYPDGFYYIACNQCLESDSSPLFVDDLLSHIQCDDIEDSDINRICIIC